jgi:N-acetylmuramoyl-L-alanine amidase
LRRRFAGVTGVPAATYPGGIIAPGLARRSDLGGLNLARVPAVFIECGNMRNAAEARMMSSAAGRERIANGIVAGIEAYLQ